MNKLVVLILIMLSASLCAQDSTYASKEYDVQIFLHQMDQVESGELNKDQYLGYSKPFSKWDTRPLGDSLVWIMNELQEASIIPNFFWGSFAGYFQVELKEAQQLPNDFLDRAYAEQAKQIRNFKKNERTFEKITELILDSEKTIFLNQTNLKRIDELYHEKDSYWRYEIPGDSPFPLSDSLQIVYNEHYSESEFTILELLDNLDVYAVYNGESGLFFLLDGVLDNSYGLAFKKGTSDITSNQLFNISALEKINSNYYYYVAR